MNKDILLDSGFDLKIKAGDFDVDFSDAQHQTAILQATTGNFRQSPRLGVNAISYLNTKGGATLLRAEIKRQFKTGGYKVKNVSLSDSKLTVTTE